MNYDVISPATYFFCIVNNSINVLKYLKQFETSVKSNIKKGGEVKCLKYVQ